MTPPNTPVITAATTAMTSPYPMLSATRAPKMANTARPRASSTRNSVRKWRMRPAMDTVTIAATEMSTR